MVQFLVNSKTPGFEAEGGPGGSRDFWRNIIDSCEEDVDYSMRIGML
jgi:hypothetical protein